MSKQVESRGCVSVVEMLCLANSVRDGGRCVAGIVPGIGWVRPVPPGGGPVSSRVATGFRAGDLVTFTLGDRLDGAPPEDRSLLSGFRSSRPASAHELSDAMRNHGEVTSHIFGTTSHRHSPTAFASLPQTLALRNPSHLTVERRADGNKRVRFALQGQQWDLPMRSDDHPPEGRSVQSPLLVCSVGASPWALTGYHYTIAVAVLELPETIGWR